MSIRISDLIFYLKQGARRKDGNKVFSFGIGTKNKRDNDTPWNGSVLFPRSA